MRTGQFSKGKIFHSSDCLKALYIRAYQYFRSELKIRKAIETCNRLIKRYGSDPSSFLLRGISKCRIQAVGLGRIDLERALERLTERNANMQRCLILYNLALVNKYELEGTLDECCRLADKDRILKINSRVTRTLVKIQREDWSAGFYSTL